MMYILVINCGSSSAKYQLFDMVRYAAVAKGMVERIGQHGSRLEQSDNGSRIAKPVRCRDHYAAIKLIVDALTDPRRGVITSTAEINGIGHRVVHGGEEFKVSTLITGRVLDSIEKYSELAPLHNPPSLSGIKACAKILKGIPQAAVFDTSFHHTMPEKAYLYGLPLEYYKKYGIRKYGFHGTSHRYVSEEAAKILRKPLARLNLVTCHLGNGCSMTAVEGGRSVDTTMGFTPLEGLIMGTRSGDLDPAIVFYIMEKERVTPDEISGILNKKSGLLGISGVSNDMRDILSSMRSGSGARGARCRLAVEMFVYRIEKYIGAYAAAMKRLDAVVFTAGISENNPWLIQRIRKDMKNVLPAGTRFLVVPTNEELLIARDTHRIINERKKDG